MANTRSSMILFTSLLALLGACGDGSGTTDDAAVDPTIDAASGATDDTGVPSEVDAAMASMDDAGPVMDPLNADPTCTSGRMWTMRDRGSPLMHPGQACIECHQRMGVRDPAASRMTIAGTVFPTGHEPTDCNGAAGTTDGGLTVEVTDATGNVITMTPNGVGNFSSTTALTLPITALVRSSVATRRMIGEVMSGDCNSCHTQTGDMMAPGRITIPVAGLPATP